MSRGSCSLWSASALWHLLAALHFSATGHQCTFGSLHYTAAFIGFDRFHFLTQGALLAANTFGPQLLFAAAAPVLAVAAERRKSDGGGGLASSLEVVLLGSGLARAGPALVSVLTAAWERRHLEVWAVFAPKVVFEAVALLLGDAAAALACWTALF